MAIAVGEKLPQGTFILIGEAGPEEVTVEQISKGRKIILFGLPGAYTGTCTSKHVPGFIL